MEKQANFRDPKEYGSVIDEMFMYYVKSENFATQSEKQRTDFVDKVQELKFIITQNPND